MLNREQLLRRNRNRTIGQLCLVSRDYMETVKYLTEHLQIGPWTLLSISDKSTRNITWHGKPIEGPWRYFVAVTQVGAMQLEVIQPESGPNPYDRFLDEKGAGLHHFKFRVDDNDILREESELLAQLVGKPILYKGEYGLDHHYYIDTYDGLGCYVETGNFADMPTPPEFLGYHPEQ